MHIVLFFTFDISLKKWKESGLLDREIKIYEKILKEENIKFTFVTYGNDEDKQIDNVPKEIKIIPAYELVKYSDIKLFRLIKSFALPFKLKKEVLEGDILKTNQLQGAWVPILLKIISRKKLIIRTGFDAYTFAKKEKKSLIVKIAYYLLTQLSLFFSNIYTVTSMQDKQNIQKSFYLSKKVEIRPNWVYLNKDLKNNKRHENKILSVGRLEEQKNYEYLIKSLKGSDFTLDIVGKGSLENKLITLAKKYSVNLNLLGRLDNNELIALYPKYKFFVITSLYEGNPKAVLEAMAAGCIVFGSRIPSIEEIITHETNGLLFSIEELNLLTLINKWKNKEKELEVLSINASNSIKEKNSLQSLVESEINDYKRLI